MRLDIQKLVSELEAVPEKQKYDRSIFRNIMGIVSGNQVFFKRASLDDIAYYMENLDEILLNEFEYEYPVINLKSIKKSERIIRRAI